MHHELYQGSLLPHKRSIRLLTLQASGSLSLSSPVECHLRVVTLPDVDSTESLPYYALSYAWQEPETIRTAPPGDIVISCNNFPIAIPMNLFVALVRLRQKFQKPTVIWIDYLCIDQSNTTERTQQVALMREIFSLASEVLIWLGEPSSTGLCEGGNFQVHYHWGEDNQSELVRAYQDSFSDYLQGNIFKFLELGHAYGIFCLLSLLSRGVSASQIPFYESSVDSVECGSWVYGLWTAVREMINRAWWKRAWVVQECFLARKATVHYGHLSASWKMFSDAARFVMRAYASGEDPLSVLCDLIWQIESPRSALDQGQYLSPLQTLVRFRNTHATVRRDKVFAFLGLLKDHFLTPDYNMSTQQVYTEVAKRIIKSTESLELLKSAQTNLSGYEYTWVPDWSVADENHQWQRVELLQFYNASKGMAPVAAMHHSTIQLPFLLVSALWVDRVAEVFEYCWGLGEGYSSFQTTVSSWEPQARKALDNIRNLSKVSSLQDLDGEGFVSSDKKWIECGYYEAFWRLLCGDLMYTSDAVKEGTWRRAERDDQNLFKAFKEDRVGPARHETFNCMGNQFFYAMHTMTAGRKAFVTEQGRLGVGHKDTSQGHHVAVLAGCTVPLVLRETPVQRCQGSLSEVLLPRGTVEQSKPVPCHEEHQCYSIIGDAYVDGIMDGQAVEGRVSEIYLV